MLFNSFVFLGLFLPVTYAVFWLLKGAKARYVWLAITGYIFYGYWDPRFCLLMAFSTLVSYSAGLGFLTWADPRRRHLCLVVPIAVDLLLLGFFKYTNFVVDSVAALLRSSGSDVPGPHLNIILPVGISFYTFHTITYIVDSYRGTIKPTRNVFEFTAYVSLFSQLVAGPIVRFRQIEQDLESLGSASRTRWLGIGVSFFLIGLLEKVVLADSLAYFVDRELAHYATLGSLATWLSVLGYTFQLYFDFAGYSDMAIGLGFMFGLRIPINFNSPYKALDPSEFWRRWHISLSTCLRDYLYIPLGGSRGGHGQTNRNLMLTMLIGGLWHGANWTFVIWGAYHGAILLAHREIQAYWDPLPRVLRQGLMFLLAVIGWVIFRATDFTMAVTLLTRMVVPTSGRDMAGMTTFLPILILAALWAMRGPNAQEIHRDYRLTPTRAIVLAAAFGACLGVMLGTGSSPFLYFQF